MVNSNKKKHLIYENNLTNVDSAQTMIWCPAFDFRFENIQWFRGLYIHRDHIPQFCSKVYHGFSTEKKLYVSFWLVDGHHF